MKSKKGQLGLDLAQNVFVRFLIIAVISVAIFLALVSLRTVTDGIIRTTTFFTNTSTVSVVNSTTITFPGTENFRDCNLIIDTAKNITDGQTIASGNYTVSGCTLKFSATGNDTWNNTVWFIDGNYNAEDTSINDITGNITGATVTFFSNTSTIYAIIIVIVIMLAIFVVVRIVSGAGGATSPGGRKSDGGAGGKAFGSDTVMGV